MNIIILIKMLEFYVAFFCLFYHKCLIFEINAFYCLYSFVSVHIFEHKYYCLFLLLNLSLGGQWSFEKSRGSCSHFVCTCFIVVGTRLSKYRQFPMEVCIFVKYSKPGGRGNIQPINCNLDYYCCILQYIKMVNKNCGLCNFCIEKVDIIQVFLFPFFFFCLS